MLRTGEATAPLCIRLFGAFELLVHGQPVPRLRFRKSQSLLALLVLREGGEAERDWLLSLLWPENRSTQSLRNSLSDLRQILGPEAVRLRCPTSRTLAFDLTGAAVDVLAFDAALRRGDPSGLEEAASLYRGPLLEQSAEEWVFQERQLREHGYSTAREKLAGHAMARGEPAEAERHLRLAVGADPLRESTQRALMELLAAGGNYAAALLNYRELRQRLHRQLNAEPDPETQTLFQRLRAEARQKGSARQAIGEAEVPPPSPVPCHDGNGSDPMGRSKVLRARQAQRSQRRPAKGSTRSLHAGGDASHSRREPPTRVAQSGRAVSHRLPLQLTRFIGRQAEMMAIQQHLAAHRLVTLTGAGGTGKTRLAIEAAATALHAYPDGVWFVELAPLAEPSLVAGTVAAALGIRERSDRAVVQTLVEGLRRKQLLLALDNCEHLVAAAAQLAETLLQSCPHLRILATSREPLDIPGELTYRVPTLTAPPAVEAWGKRSESNHEAPGPESLLQYEAVRLFVERATTAQPAFALTSQNAPIVAQVCRRLEGIPLALELAAARLQALPLETLHQRLDNMLALLTGGRRTALPRHQTLRALIDWSYDLLTPPEQALLRRLSVFAGGCTLEAAEAICSGVQVFRCSGVQADKDNIAHDFVEPEHLKTRTPEPLTLDLLTRLVERSLVLYEEREGEGRYRLLEMIREYSREQLAVGGETEVQRERHAEFFLGLAERTGPELVGSEGRRCLDRLEREHDNLRAALAWSVESGKSEIGLRLGSALQEFWDRRGYLKEGREQLLNLLAQPGAAARTAARARALTSAGCFVRLQSDRKSARRLHEESLAIYRSLEDRAGVATALLHLGWLALDRWDAASARPLVEESLGIRRELDDPRGVATSLHSLSWVARHEYDLVAARAMAEESLGIWRALGDRAKIVEALGSLAHMTFLDGDIERARPLIEESLAAARELDDKIAIAWGITRLGFVAHWEEDYATARGLFEQSLPLWRELDAGDGLTETLFHLGSVLQHQGEIAAGYAIFEEMLAIGRERGFVVPEALVLLGNAAGRLDRWEEAAARCAESLRLHRSIRLGSRHVVAWGLLGMARVAIHRGRWARAARLLGAAEALWAGSIAPRWPNERTDLAGLVAAAGAQLGEAEFAVAWAEGQAVPVEVVIAEALEEAPVGKPTAPRLVSPS